MGKSLNKQSLSQVKESIINRTFVPSNQKQNTNLPSLSSIKEKVISGDLLRENYAKQVQDTEYAKKGLYQYTQDYQKEYNKIPTIARTASDVASVGASFSKGLTSPISSAVKLATGGKVDLNKKLFDTSLIDETKHNTFAMKMADTIAGGVGGTLALAAGGQALGGLGKALGASEAVSSFAGNAGLALTMYPTALDEKLQQGYSTPKAVLLATLESAAGAAIENVGGFKLAEGDITLKGLNTIIEEASEEFIEAIADEVINRTVNLDAPTGEDIINTIVEALQNGIMSIPTTLILGGGNAILSDAQMTGLINDVAKQTGMSKESAKQLVTDVYNRNQVESTEAQTKAQEQAKEIDKKYGEINSDKEEKIAKKITDEQSKKDEKAKRAREGKEVKREQRQLEQAKEEELDRTVEVNETDTDEIKAVKEEISRYRTKLEQTTDEDIKQLLQEKIDTKLTELADEIELQDDKNAAIKQLMKLGFTRTEAVKVVNKEQEVKEEPMIEKVKEPTEKVEKPKKIKEEKTKVEKTKEEKSTKFSDNIGTIKNKKGKDKNVIKNSVTTYHQTPIENDITSDNLNWDDLDLGLHVAENDEFIENLNGKKTANEVKRLKIELKKGTRYETIKLTDKDDYKNTGYRYQYEDSRSLVDTLVDNGIIPKYVRDQIYEVAEGKDEQEEAEDAGRLLKAFLVNDYHIQVLEYLNDVETQNGQPFTSLLILDPNAINSIDGKEFTQNNNEDYDRPFSEIYKERSEELRAELKAEEDAKKEQLRLEKEKQKEQLKLEREKVKKQKELEKELKKVPLNKQPEVTTKTMSLEDRVTNFERLVNNAEKTIENSKGSKGFDKRKYIDNLSNMYDKLIADGAKLNTSIKDTLDKFITKFNNEDLDAAKRKEERTRMAQQEQNEAKVKVEMKANNYKKNDLYTFAKQEVENWIQSDNQTSKAKALGWYSQYKDAGGTKSIPALDNIIQSLGDTQQEATEQATKNVTKQTESKEDFKNKLGFLLDNKLDADLFQGDLFNISNNTFYVPVETMTTKEKNALNRLSEKQKGNIKRSITTEISDPQLLGNKGFQRSGEGRNTATTFSKLTYDEQATSDTVFARTNNEIKKYEGKPYAKGVFKSAIEAGMTNTEANHELLNVVAEVAERLHRPIYFKNAKDIINDYNITGGKRTDKLTNYILGGVTKIDDYGPFANQATAIVINTTDNPVEMRNQTLAHEIFHFLKAQIQTLGSTKDKQIFKSLENIMSQWEQETWDVEENKKNIARRYADENIREEERFAELFGYAINKDGMFNKLFEEKTLGRQIMNFLKRAYYRATGQREKYYLESIINRANKVFNKASTLTAEANKTYAGFENKVSQYANYMFDTSGIIDNEAFDDVVEEENQNAKEEIKEKQPALIKQFKNNKLENIAVDWWNKLRPLEKLDKIKSMNTGVETHEVMQAETMLETAYYQAQSNIANYQSDLNGKYIGKSLNTIMANMEALSPDKYAIADRLWKLKCELSRRTITNKISMFNEYSTTQIKALIKDLETRYSDIANIVEETNKEYQVYKRNQNQMNVDAGLISKTKTVSQEFAKKHMKLSKKYISKNTTPEGDVIVSNVDFLDAENPYYIPLEKYGWDNKIDDFKNTPKGSGLATKAIKGLKEEAAKWETYDTRVAVRQDAMVSMRRLRQQQLYSLIGEYCENYINKTGISNDDLTKQLKANNDILEIQQTHDTIMRYYKDGKWVIKKIPSSIYNALTPYTNAAVELLNTTETGQKITEVMKKNSEILRSAYTGVLSPFYAGKNKIMDVQDYIYSTDADLQDVIKVNENYWSDRKNNTELYNQFRALGLDSQVKGYDIKTKTVLNNKVVNKFQKAVNTLEEFNAMVEASTRYNAYKAEMLKTGNVNEAIRKAKEATTNFSKTGRIANVLDRHGITIYFGSSIAGFNKAIETNITRIADGVQAGLNGLKNGQLTQYEKSCVNKMVRQIAKMALYGVSTTLLRKLLKGLDDEDTYDRLPSYIKDNAYIIPLGKGNFVSIPRGRMLSIPYALNNLFASDISEVDKKSIAEAVQYVWNRTGVNDINNSLSLSPFKQVLTNKNGFGYQIVDEDASLNEKTKTKLKYIFDAYGGVIADIVDMGIDYKNGKDIKIPIISTYAGSTNTLSVNQARYWQYINKYQDSKNLIDKLTYQSLYYDYTRQIAPLKKQVELYEQAGETAMANELKHNISDLYDYIMSNVDDPKIDINGNGSLISYRGYTYERQEDEYGVQSYHKVKK